MKDMKDREILTYSSLKAFRNCRRMYDLRHNRCLAPLEENQTLHLGSVFHGCMERWHLSACNAQAGGRDMAAPKETVVEAILDFIDASYPDRLQDARRRRDWHLARAMFRGYVERYPAEDFEVVAVEKEFCCPIVNPETGCESRTFVMRGKVDGIVKRGGEYFLLEHKSAASIDGGYIERLPMDFQIALYADYIGRAMNLKIAGIIYNVVAKAQIKQGKGETEAEFEERRAALIAQSKTGRSSAKRKMPESDEAFQERLAAKYQEDGMYHREALYLSDDQFETLHSEVWELTQQLLHARRTKRWYMNADFCFHFHRPCAFWEICRSNENPNVVENLYRVVPAHPELSRDVQEEAPF